MPSWPFIDVDVDASSGTVGREQTRVLCLEAIEDFLGEATAFGRPAHGLNGRLMNGPRIWQWTIELEG